MPLTARGKKIMKSMKEQYGKKKGEQVFYASKNKGKIKGVEKLRFGGAYQGKKSYDAPSNTATRGRDPRVQYKTTTTLSPEARKTLTAQRETARARISPSTTPKGQAIAGTVGLIGSVLGIPGGFQLGKRMVDYSSLAFGVPKKTKKVKDTIQDIREGPQQKIVKPIVVETPKPIDETLIKPKDNFFNFVSYKVGGLSGGVKYGPPPKRGPNSQVPPVKMKKGGYKK